MDQSIYYNKIDPVMHDIPGNVLRNHLYKLFVWFFCVILVVLVCFDWVEYYLNITLVAKPAIRAFLLSIFLFVIIVPVPIIRGLRLPIAFPLIALGYLFFTYALFEENIASG